MKNHFAALDGFRGFLALSVVLSHINVSNRLVAHIPYPILQQVYFTFSAGSLAVQAFFVLSGFLMAFLYPTVLSKISFIQKRYTRIFPALVIVVLYSWLVLTFVTLRKLYIEIPLFILLVCGAHLVYKYIKDRWKKESKRKIFLSFLLLQIIIIVFAVFTKSFMETPADVHPYTSILTLGANLTLTYRFVRNVVELDNVFWTLAVEILFYVLYPILVTPLIKYCKRKSVFKNIMIIIALTFILGFIDYLLTPYPSFATLGIWQMTNFMIGITYGIFYNSKSKLLIIAKQILENHWVNIGIIAVFICVFWGTGYFQSNFSDTIFTRTYYYLASWLFGLVIITLLNPNALLTKLFSFKALTFLGMISFSMYIVHIKVIAWMLNIQEHLIQTIHNAHYEVLIYSVSFFVMVLAVIVVSYFLYKMIEKLNQKVVAKNKT